MKSLRLTEIELLSMKQFYEKELDDTLNKLQHIRKVLKKLGAVVPEIEVGAKGTGEVKVSKRGRKSKWGTYIKNKLDSTKTPMTYEQLVDEAMSDMDIPKSKRDNTRQAIISSAYRLRNIHGELQTFAMKGSRIKFVALPDWFGSTGRIQKEFSSRIKEIPQPVFQEGKRPGRPRKNKPVEDKPKRSPGRPKGSTKTKKASTRKSPANTKKRVAKEAGSAKKAGTKK